MPRMTGPIQSVMVVAGPRHSVRVDSISGMKLLLSFWKWLERNKEDGNVLILFFLSRIQAKSK